MKSLSPGAAPPRALSPRAYAGLLWTAICVALAGLAQVTAGLAGADHLSASGHRASDHGDWLTPFIAEGTPPAPAREAGTAAADSSAAPAVPLSELAARALAHISYPWQRLGYRIVFEPARPGLRGETVPTARRIYVYLSPGEPESLVAHVIAHEIGHAVDFTYNDTERRAKWMRMRGIDPATPWFGCSGCADFATPAGDFAETFAWWQVGDADYSMLAAAPDADQMRSLTALYWPSAPAASPAPPPSAPAQQSTGSGGVTRPSLLCVDTFCTG